MLGKVWKINALRGADFSTPLCFFARGICLIGCNLIGCGQAMPCDWGIYSPNYGCRVFPMDLIDLLATFAIGVISLIYAKRLNYKGNGRVFALAMIGLGMVRTLIQFGSTDRYFGIRGLNDETIISLIAIIMGTMIFQYNEKKQN
jgi:prolipoprotein diacylglyceryltransferase